MTDLWNSRKDRLLDLIAGEPSPGISKVSAAEVRHLMELQELPYHALLGPDCWIAGGRLLRWLRGDADAETGDFDLYFPSCAALSSKLRAMFDSGYRFRGFRTWKERICCLCGRKVGIRPHLPWMRRLVPPLSCKDCRDKPVRSFSPSFTELVPISQALIERSKLVAVELASPEGHVFQMVTAYLLPTPSELIETFDLSVCQLAMDGEALYHGPLTLRDLTAGRFTVVRINYPPATMWRIFKYMHSGFRPHRGVFPTAFAAYWRWLRHRGQWRTSGA